MADTNRAIDFVMRQEDSLLSGVITQRANDLGGLTRFGLTARWHPALLKDGFFDPSMSTDEAIPLAERTYAEEYAEPLRLASIEDQALATSLLSFAVLEGKREAVTLFQRAIVAVTSAPLTVDGIVGSKTVAAANAADPEKLRLAFVQFAEAFFEHLGQVVPSQAANLPGWRNRAKQLLALNGEPVPAQTESA